MSLKERSFTAYSITDVRVVTTENYFRNRLTANIFRKCRSNALLADYTTTPEPSFYTGAMYVSYALQVALFTTVYVALRVLFNPSTEVYIITTMALAVLLLPVTLRLSRAIYINFFYSYKREFDKTLKARLE
ncbi:MAG: DUF983 domain-containing protein [Cyclobacteriaceae bacterium]|nr:DUF983 domain-containing protein [Cyclobacteriaceae bacterium]UYN86299.1 MAG: DUF983 domain-containing protein [Cyclobacteriaceae bacterium]